MIRLSVTDLESYRYFKDREDSKLDDLLRDLAHVEPPTRQMTAGRAWAKLWEHALPGELDAVTVDGWRFVFDLDVSVYVPLIRELKAEEVFETPSGLVTLVGKVDGFEGLTVRDQKLSERFEVEDRYTDSVQWKAYLTMLKASKFVYDVFIGKYDDVEQEVTIVDYHPLSFYAYPDMRADVEKAVRELAEIVTVYQAQIETLRTEAGGQKGAA
jgi:hypothetical protein